MNAHTFRTPINPGPGLPAGPGRPRSRTAAFRHAALAGALAAALPAPALALPGAPSVAGGSASFQQTGGTLTVINTPNAIINWGSFSIGANEITRFVQQSSASAVLNRVVGQDPSRILGQLQSNGRVFLINPNGVLFGAGARVDTAGLVASALNLSDADFLAGRLKFTGTGTAGKVENQGTISTGQGGFVYLIAPEVDNSGLIAAANGDILLAAGHSVEIADGLNPALRVQVTAPAGQVTNLGQLLAESGRIGLHGGLVANAGTVSASSAVAEGGRIYLRASERIALTDTSRLLADGTRGGEITAIVAQGDRIAGKLVGRGEIRARGDGSPGSGGFVETSAGWLEINALKVDTRGGAWLLDPDDVEINNSATVTDATLVTPDTVQNALAQGDFVVQTRASETTGNGDIFVNADLTWSSNTLTLNAHRHIRLADDIRVDAAALNFMAGGALVLGSGARIGASGLTQIRAASIGQGPQVIANQDLAAVQNRPGPAQPAADQVLIDGRGVALSNDLDLQTEQSVLTLSGGTLRGKGSVYGNLTLDGGARLAPGASPGTLTIAGNLTLTPTSVLDVEVWGTSSGLYDLIAVTGTVTLDGALYATVGGGYFPVQGDTVTFMTASGTSGALASVNLYPGFTLNVLSNGLQLEATETVLSQPVLTALASNNANLYLGALSHETPLLYASGQGSPTASSTGALIQTAEMVLPALIPDSAPTTDPATETFAQSLARLLAQGLSPEEALKRASSAPGGQDGAQSASATTLAQSTAPLARMPVTDLAKDPAAPAFAQNLAQSLAQGVSPAEAIMRARLMGEFTRLILDTRQQEIPHESRLVCR